MSVRLRSASAPGLDGRRQPRWTRWSAVCALVAGAALATAACGGDQKRAEGPAEEAGEAVDEAAEETRDTAEDTAEDAGDTVEDATDDP